MINVSFILRNPSAKSNRSKVYVTCRWCYQQVKWSTGISIDVSQWDQGKREPIPSHPNYLRIKSRLIKIEKVIQDIYFDYEDQVGGIIPKGIFKEKLAIALNKRDHPIVANRSVIYFGRDYCEGKRKTLQESFAAFLEFTQGQDVLFDEINFEFIEDYTEYMKEKGLAVSTINLRLQGLNQIIKAAFKRKYHANHFTITGDNKLNSSANKKPKIALEEDELINLAAVNVPEEMKPSKDLFFFGFFTGQRYSDYSRISPEMFSNGVLSLTQKKTGVCVEVPVNLLDQLSLPFTFQELLEEYNYTAPSVDYYQFAKDVKKIGEMAGIDADIENIVDKYGRRFVPEKERTIPKYKRMSSMTCRKTFATILYRSGVNLDSIRVFTGHESVKTLMIYINVKKEERRLIAQKDISSKLGRAKIHKVSLN